MPMNFKPRQDRGAPEPETGHLGEQEAPKPSRTQLKAEMNAITKFGALLIGLPDGKLARLDLPDDLRDAILQARRFPSHGARKRQLLTVSKIMRGMDIGAIRADLAEVEHGRKPRIVVSALTQ